MRFLPATLLALAVALAGTAPPVPPAAPPAVPVPRGLEAEPMVAEAIGLRIYLPAGTQTRSVAGPGGITYLAADDKETWSMRFSTLLPAVEGATAAALAAEHLQAVQKTGRRFQMIFDGPREAGGVPGHLLYVQQALNDQNVVNGWLILPTSPQSFVVVTVFAGAEEFPRLRQIFDASFDTIQLRAAGQLAAERDARLARARQVLATFNPAHLRAAIGERQWFRVFRPAEGGNIADDTELAYLTLQVSEGMRGELTPERSPKSFGALESEQGLLAILEARIVEDPQAGRYQDLDARYWMSWDRGTEAWSVRQTRRSGSASRTAAETGVRTGDSLEVIHSSREQQTREPARFTAPDVYLSQAEALLLGALLPRDGSAEGEMAFACYDSKSRGITDRIDSFQPSSDGSRTWVLTTLQFSETSPVTQQYDDSGRRTRRIDPDGTVTQRINPAELHRLWKSKGLLPERGGQGGKSTTPP